MSKNESGNAKKNSQKSKKPLQPIRRKIRKAIVTITPDEQCKVDIQTGNVSDLEMFKYLSDMARHFAVILCNDAAEVVGDSIEEQNKYLDWRIKQAGIN